MLLLEYELSLLASLLAGLLAAVTPIPSMIVSCINAETRLPCGVPLLAMGGEVLPGQLLLGFLGRAGAGGTLLARSSSRGGALALADDRAALGVLDLDLLRSLEAAVWVAAFGPPHTLHEL